MLEDLYHYVGNENGFNLHTRKIYKYIGTDVIIISKLCKSTKNFFKKNNDILSIFLANETFFFILILFNIQKLNLFLRSHQLDIQIALTEVGQLLVVMFI